MPSRTIKFSMSFTELATFRRLVTLMEQVEAHADQECDRALGDLVESARVDLLRLRETDA